MIMAAAARTPEQTLVAVPSTMAPLTPDQTTMAPRRLKKPAAAAAVNKRPAAAAIVRVTKKARKN